MKLKEVKKIQSESQQKTPISLTSAKEYGEENLKKLISDSYCNDWQARLVAVTKLKSIDDPRARGRILEIALHDGALITRQVAVNYAQRLNIRKNGKTITLRKQLPLKKRKDMKDFDNRVKHTLSYFINRKQPVSIGFFLEHFKKNNPKQYDLISGRQYSGDSIIQWFRSYFKAFKDEKYRNNELLSDLFEKKKMMKKAVKTED